MKKILIIAGITASGKTSLALKLAKEFKGELLSADSRQVYKGMDIGTGKDIPPTARKVDSSLLFQGQNISYYQLGRIRIWGYDLVEPDADFSLAHFRKISQIVLKDIIRRGRLPIVVGGTGLYLKSLLQPLVDIYIPPDPGLRNSYHNQPLAKLQQDLKKVNPQRYVSMNNSDRHNPRRLIRALEIEKNRQKTGKNLRHNKPNPAHYLSLVIGLQAAKPELDRLIDQRVDQRLKMGFSKEVEKLVAQGYNFDLPSMSALGYKEWQAYLNRQKSKKEAIRAWKLAEHAYAARQFTWFKKQEGIKWFTVTQKGYRKQVVRLIKLWYSKS